MCNIVLCNLYITLTRKFYYFVFCKVTQAQLCVTNKQNEFLKSSDRYLIFFKKFIQNVINQKTIWNPISILENLISSVTIFKKKKFIYISIYPSINIFTCQNTRDSILQYWKTRLSRMRKSKNDSSFQTQCNIAEIFQSKFFPPSISSTFYLAIHKDCMYSKPILTLKPMRKISKSQPPTIRTFSSKNKSPLQEQESFAKLHMVLNHRRAWSSVSRTGERETGRLTALETSPRQMIPRN